MKRRVLLTTRLGDSSESGDEGRSVDEHNRVDPERTSTPSPAGLSAEHDDDAATEQTDGNEGDSVAGLAEALSQLQIPTPSFRLKDLVLAESCPLLFRGESGDRELPLAIGAMRGSLANVWATCNHVGKHGAEACHFHSGPGNVPTSKTISLQLSRRVAQNSENRDRLQFQSPGACVVSS